MVGREEWGANGPARTAPAAPGVRAPSQPSEPIAQEAVQCVSPDALRDASATRHGFGLLGEVKRFTLYEARSHFYLVAHDTSESRFRILKIDRVPPLFAQEREPEEAAPPAESSDSEATPSVEPSRSEAPSESSPEPQRGHKRDPSMQNAVQSIIADDPDAMPQAQVGTLSTEITELASTLASADPPSRDVVPSTCTPLISQSGLRYLGIDDEAIPRLKQTSEWKGYASTANEAPERAMPPSGAEAMERTVPPIASLSAPRSSKPARNHLVAHESSLPDAGADEAQETAHALDASDEASWKLHITSDNVEYNAAELNELLGTIREGNRNTGGLKDVGRFFGLVGFVRFTAGYYMVLVSRRSAVALIGGHYIYHCDETEVLPVCHASLLSSLPGRSKTRDSTEAQLLRTFRQVDLSKNFYFSYTYDITRTLQENLTGPRQSVLTQSEWAWGFNERWMWNFHLLCPAFDACRCVETASDAHKRQWVLPLVHGFVDQAKLLVLGRTLYVTLIARRSRHFAGARFHKRGANGAGYVANDVETEQLVNEPVTSPFFGPSVRGDAKPHRPSPHFTSFVMLRGSIPIYWTQDSTNMSPRPPIAISVADPYFVPAMRHFDLLFRTYGTPVIVLNLIKSKERQPRESKLLHAYSECIQYLNQFLPNGSDGKPDRRIRYVAWDMSRASKSRDQDVIEVLETLAEDMLHSTCFFHSGPAPLRRGHRLSTSTANLERRTALLLQHGVARVNCVDCLDRTNAAQFVMGKTALAHQLHALGLLERPHLSFESDAINMLTEMYHDLGDTIALQYGGSALAHTTDTYRKINHWTSHSRDMVEGLKRYYANSFADADKQAAIDLFLGQDREEGMAVSTSVRVPAPRLRHVHAYLAADEDVAQKQAYINAYVNSDSHFWENYYRPSLFTDMQRHHAYKMTAVHQQPALLPGNAFPALNEAAPPRPSLRAHRRSFMGNKVASPAPALPGPLHRGILGGMRRWMNPDVRKHAHAQPSGKHERATGSGAPSAQAAATLLAEPGALEGAVAKSLHPSISKQELREYAAYTTQFAQLAFQHTPRTTEADMHIYERAEALPKEAMHGASTPSDADPALATYVRQPRLELVGDIRTVVPRPRIVSAPATASARVLARASVLLGAASEAAPDPKLRSYAAWLHMTHVR